MRRSSKRANLPRAVRLAAATLATGTASIAAIVVAAPQAVTGPTAVYWIDATTEEGLPAGGAAPSMRQMMGMAASGGMESVRRRLWLRLGSDQPSGDPRAPGTHIAPAALDARPFPLQPPGRPGAAERVRETPGTPVPPGSGELLVFWGCGTHVGPGQPRRIDLSKAADPGVAKELAALLEPSLGLAPVNPPRSTDRRAFLEWPQPDDPRQLAANASLAGHHVVTAPAAPRIDFSLAADQDFLPPVRVTGGDAAPDGSLALRWQAVTRAQAIAVTAVGSAGGRTVVMWASSQPALAWHGRAPDFLADRDQARLVASGALLPGTATACAIPAEAAAALKGGGMYRIHAYGRDSDLAWPPRPADPRQPWAMQWAVKVRHRSLASGLLGMASAPVTDEKICGQECGETTPRKKRGLLGRIRETIGQ